LKNENELSQEEMKKSEASKRKQDEIWKKLESVSEKFSYSMTNFLNDCFSQEQPTDKGATCF